MKRASLTARSVLRCTCLGVLLSAALAAQMPGALQKAEPATEDVELAAALTKRDLASATRLLGKALAAPLPLPATHAATAVLGPSAAAELPRLFAATAGDAAAAARINNLGVALALRGWFQSAAVALGGALLTAERRFQGRPWPSVFDPRGLPAGMLMQQQYSATPNTVVVNIQNLERVTGIKTQGSGPPRYEFALGLLETASKHATMQERLRAMAEVFPPVVSRALSQALNGPRPPAAAAAEPFSRTYGGFAQYKGTYLRGLPSRRALKPYQQRPADRDPTPPGASGDRRVWDRGEIWDDRGVYGFNPSTRLRQGETLVDIYLVELGDTARDLRREYVAVITSLNASSAPVQVLSLGSAEAIDKAVDDFLDVLTLETQQMTLAAVQALADKVWRPMARAVPAGTVRLWIAPDGRLTQVPWQAVSIAAAGRAAPAISIVDSGETIREPRPRPAAESRRILLAGNPDYGASAKPEFVRLPKSAAELASIEAVARAKGLEPSVLQGADVTEPNIARSLPAKIVHVATHGKFNPAKFRPPSLSVGPWLVFDPQLRQGTDAERLKALAEQAFKGRSDLQSIAQGVLALSGANTAGDPFAPGSPAFLTDVDLAGLDLTATDLVVLSACDLGQTEQSAFQGLGSMQSAVVVAGAKSLLSSLWKVPDEETTAFMKLFYENLLVRGLSLADALREAQLSASTDAKGRSRSPYLWAGWTLFGEGW